MTPCSQSLEDSGTESRNFIDLITIAIIATQRTRYWSWTLYFLHLFMLCTSLKEIAKILERENHKYVQFRITMWQWSPLPPPPPVVIYFQCLSKPMSLKIRFVAGIVTIVTVQTDLILIFLVFPSNSLKNKKGKWFNISSNTNEKTALI